MNPVIDESQQEEPQEAPIPPETPDIAPKVLPEEEKQEASGVPKEIEDAILACFKHYRQEDEALRNQMIAFWTKLENYWNGITDIFWDYTAADWRRPNQSSDDLGQDNPEAYDKILNIYRAYGESIIAALSVKLPEVTFYPDDADVPEDIETAKAYTEISDLIKKHNKGQLLFMRALFLLFNSGVIASYIYSRESVENGTIRLPEYGDDLTLNHHTSVCPLCKGAINQETTQGDDQHTMDSVDICPSCGAVVEPNVQTEQELIPQIMGYIDAPKSRTHIEVFGPKFAQFPFYARKQSDIPYLHLRFEQHIALVRDFYRDNQEILGKIPKGGSSGDAAGTYDRLARAYQQSTSDVDSLVTITCQWLRPWAFEILEDDLALKCKKYYPKGCYAVLINDSLVAEAREELLDEHWEICEDPISLYLHADPIGKSLAPVQEISNEINDLALETFRHSIPETFVDPSVLDFKKYGAEESKPGMVFPAKPPQGKALADGFHSVKTATLNEEIGAFDTKIQEKGQLVSGAFPSIFGGSATSGSKTASEYSDSQAMALQRLQLHWVKLKFWWAGTLGKASTIYANTMVSDEKVVKKSSESQSGFINSWIKQVELTGKIGNIEPDIDEELPMSFAQIKNALFELISLNNDYVNEGVFNPNNVPIVSKAVGIRNFYIPGQNDRNKQNAEIADLIKGIPRPINPLVDDHKVSIQTLKYWMTSTAGINCEKFNPQGYQMVQQHLEEHLQAQTLATDANTETPAGTAPDSAIESVRN